MTQPLPSGHEALLGPERLGSEHVWTVALTDGSRGVLGQLLPELAEDESIRRRYLRDLDRLLDLEVPSIAKILAVGREGVPWRLREDPPGTSLESWLKEAPRSSQECFPIARAFLEALVPLHERGVVLRDFQPRLAVVRTVDARPEILFTDVGLSRVDILSSRTAASLILESSPYASPEQLRRTTIDQRSDLYAFGVVIWRALTGALPFGDGVGLFEARPRLPPLAAPITGGGQMLDRLIRACLSEAPEKRPLSAAHALRLISPKSGALVPAPESAACQSCGALLRKGQRLCLSCGKEAVQLASDREGSCTVRLVRIKEEVESLDCLRGFLTSVTRGAVPPLNFVHGDPRMYSKAEQARRFLFPSSLFDGLPQETAARVVNRMRALDLDVDLIDSDLPPRSRTAGRRAAFRIGVGLATLSTVGLIATGAFISSWLWLLFLVPAIGGIVTAAAANSSGPWASSHLDLQLKQAPAALPASDPYVLRLAAILSEDTAPDLKSLLGELALALQTFVDRTVDADATEAEAKEIEMVMEPLDKLVDRIATDANEVQKIDRELSELDEGVLARAYLASTSASATDQGAKREMILESLDRLRALEDRRALLFHQLLELGDLLQRTVAQGLRLSEEID